MRQNGPVAAAVRLEMLKEVGCGSSTPPPGDGAVSNRQLGGGENNNTDGGPRLRGLRKGDSRAMVPEGSGPRVALRLSSLLPLPCASRRRVDVLRQGRQHLLQRGLL